MSRDPTLGRNAIRRQFAELGNLLDKPMAVYLIGGGALTLQELKGGTKDIDLIVDGRATLERLRSALLAAGYEPTEDLEEEYKALGAAFILEKETRRFDVFDRQVASVLMLSDTMRERSQHLFDEGALTVRMVSLEDIFLFKSVANREDDVDDMIVLAQTGLDEAIIVDEARHQLDLVGTDHFIGSMKHKLDRVAERGYSFAVQDDVEALYARSQDGKQIVQAIWSLQEIEYDDAIYEGVPKRAVEQRLPEIDVDAGLMWLDRINRVAEASDASLIVIPTEDGNGT